MKKFAASTQSTPLLVILYGPAGSGKSTFVDKAYSKFPHMDVDTFVYQNNEYKSELAGLRNEDKKDKAIMRKLYAKYMSEAHDDFEREIKTKIAARNSLMIDVTVKDVRWLKSIKIQPDLEKMEYKVHVMYPYTSNINEIMNRLFYRFSLPDGQTPAPKAIVEETLSYAPKNYCAKRFLRFWTSL